MAALNLKILPEIPTEPLEATWKSIYPTPEIGAALVAPGVDEFYEEECYVWCRLIEGDTDWEIEVGGNEFVGVIPEWWGRDIDDRDNGLGIQWMLIGNHSSSGNVMGWALREGLSPGQEFLVYCSRPEWYRCSYEYEEYDFDKDLRVIRRESPTISLREFERAVTEVFEDIRKREQQWESKNKAQWAETRRMYLRWEWGGGFGLCDPWVRVALVSTLSDPDRPEIFGWVPLAWGRSDKDSEEEALFNLKVSVEKKHPDLNLEELPVRRG